MAHCLLQGKDLLTKFWDEAVYYANYLLNLVLIYAVSSITLVEKWCGENPLVGHLKKFRCVAWKYIFDACRNKFDAKSHACIMMGYSEDSKSY